MFYSENASDDNAQRIHLQAALSDRIDASAHRQPNRAGTSLARRLQSSVFRMALH